MSEMKKYSAITSFQPKRGSTAEGAGALPYPTHVSKEARSIIEDFMCPDPAARLGCRGAGQEDIQLDPWLSSVTWDTLETSDPPHKPECADLVTKYYATPDGERKALRSWSPSLNPGVPSPATVVTEPSGWHASSYASEAGGTRRRSAAKKANAAERHGRPSRGGARDRRAMSPRRTILSRSDSNARCLSSVAEVERARLNQRTHHARVIVSLPGRVPERRA